MLLSTLDVSVPTHFMLRSAGHVKTYQERRLIGEEVWSTPDVLGVYLNGIAASLAYQRVGLHMVATDLIDGLPKAMKPYDMIK